MILECRIAVARATTLYHAPMDRPTGATPFVSSKHVIVATIQPSWSPVQGTGHTSRTAYGVRETATVTTTRRTPAMGGLRAPSSTTKGEDATRSRKHLIYVC